MAGGSSGRDRIDSSSSFKDSLSKFVAPLSGIVGQIGPIRVHTPEVHKRFGQKEAHIESDSLEIDFDI